MFHQKFKKLLERLQKCTFGQTYACLYSVECQKRGLPHAHILLCITIDNKIKREENNLFISAEILDKDDDAELHGLVMAHIIYDPCGSINHNSPCMVESKYSKQFPKAFLHCTEQGSHSYLKYQYCKPEDGGHTGKISMWQQGWQVLQEVTNQWVVSPIIPSSCDHSIVTSMLRYAPASSRSSML